MRRKRPFGVYVIALMQVLNGLAIGLNILLRDDLDVSRSIERSEALGMSLGFPGIVLALSLLMMWRWAWMVTMLWTGLSLGYGLYTYYFSSDPNFITMAINVFIVFYLNQRDVQQAFER